MEILTAADFIPKKGDDFKMVFADGSTLDLKLSDVTLHTVREFPGKTRDPFSLFFDGTPEVQCPQGIYRLRHEATGWLHDIFLVPIARNADATYRYQAVFN